MHARMPMFCRVSPFRAKGLYLLVSQPRATPHVGPENQFGVNHVQNYASKTVCCY